MTSKATQAIANTNEPAYGTLLSNQIVNDGASVSLSELFSPLLEPEIIFIVQEDLPYDADLETIRYHTRIAPALKFQMQDIKLVSKFYFIRFNIR